MSPIGTQIHWPDLKHRVVIVKDLYAFVEEGQSARVLHEIALFVLVDNELYLAAHDHEQSHTRKGQLFFRVDDQSITVFKRCEDTTQALMEFHEIKDPKEAALRSYLTQIRHYCRVARESFRFALKDPSLFGTERTSDSVRSAAWRLRKIADDLRVIFLLPFGPLLHVISEELEKVVTLFERAAAYQKKELMEDARGYLEHSYRALLLWDVHTRLEQLRVELSRYRSTHRLHGQPQLFTDVKRAESIEELRALQSMLTTRDPFTLASLEPREHEYWLPSIVSGVQLAYLELHRKKEDGNPDMEQIGEYLKQACTVFVKI